MRDRGRETARTESHAGGTCGVLAMLKRQYFTAVLGIAAIAGASCAQAASGSIMVGGTGAILASMRALGKTFTRADPHIVVKVPDSLGSSGGIKAVLAGALDICFSARPLKDSEKAAGARAFPFARTPFLLATSSRSQIKTMSAAGLASLIAAGGTWPDGTPLRLILRPRSDTDTLLTEKYFPTLEMPLRSARIRRRVRIAATDQEALDLAESAPGTLVPTSLILLISERRKLAPLIVGDITPNIENMENGTYRKTKTIYLVTAAKIRPPALAFLQYLDTVEARAILRRSGAIQLSESVAR